jgi:lantibiotic modifying enzyme
MKKDGFGIEDCICHGSLGNYEVLMSIAEFQNNSHLMNSIQKDLYERIELISGNHENWITGVNNQQYALNGLFLGLTGIGYNIMRLF